VRARARSRVQKRKNGSDLRNIDTEISLAQNTVTEGAGLGDRKRTLAGKTQVPLHELIKRYNLFLFFWSSDHFALQLHR